MTDREGKIKGYDVRRETVVDFQWVIGRFRDVRCLPAMCAGIGKEVFQE